LSRRAGRLVERASRPVIVDPRSAAASVGAARVAFERAEVVCAATSRTAPELQIPARNC